MRFRKVRIAWSVGWAVVALVLCGLWVRSYWVTETVSWGHRTKSRAVVGAVVSNYGTLVLGRVVSPPAKRLPLEYTDGWEYRSGASQRDREQFGWESGGGEVHVQFPTWLLVSAFGLVGAFPWFRFSLRTLLIALTLVATGLGLSVYVF